MGSRSNNLVASIAKDVFKALPPQAQWAVVAVMFPGLGVVLIVSLRMQENRVLEPKPIVQDVPYFDDKDPVHTFRWIAMMYKPVAKVAQDVASYKGSNLLRTERDGELEKAQGEYRAIIQAKVGTRILWPVIVAGIRQEDVQIKNAFESVEQDGDRITTYLHYEEFPYGRESYSIAGHLKIGTAITLEDAKKLDVGGWLFVDGKIAKIEGESIDVVDCHAVLPASQ